MKYQVDIQVPSWSKAYNLQFGGFEESKFKENKLYLYSVKYVDDMDYILNMLLVESVYSITNERFIMRGLSTCNWEVSLQKYSLTRALKDLCKLNHHINEDFADKRPKFWWPSPGCVLLFRG